MSEHSLAWTERFCEMNADLLALYVQSYSWTQLKASWPLLCIYYSILSTLFER